MHGAIHGFDIFVDEGGGIFGRGAAMLRLAHAVSKATDVFRAGRIDRTILDADRGRFAIPQQNDNVTPLHRYYPGNQLDRSIGSAKNHLAADDTGHWNLGGVLVARQQNG